MGTVLVALLAQLEYEVQRERERNEFAGCMFWVAVGCFACILLYLLIRAGARSGIRDTAQSTNVRVNRPTTTLPAMAPAAGNSGPGHYRVNGVDKETGMDTTWHCTADNATNARVKGELQGIIVTAVEFVGR